MSSLWAIVNQVQLYFFLLLTRASIPINIQNIIIGNKFSLNIASFIPFPNIEFLNSIINEFNFNLSNQSLELLNIKSDSSIFNLYSAITLVIMIIPFHLLIVLLSKLMPISEFNGRWKWIKKRTSNLINKLFIALTFSWYIRYILQTNQYAIVSCVYEIYNLNFTDSDRIYSLVFAILTLWICFLLIIFILFLSFSSYEVSKENHNKLGEIFSGVKLHKHNKFCVSLLLIRRATFVILLITVVTIDPWMLISWLSLLQIWYTGYLVIVRPFESAKDNLIEILNEIYFSVLLSSLIYLNSEKNWSSTTTAIYMWVITSNTILIFIIILSKQATIITLVDFIKNIVLIFKNKCQRSEENGEVNQHLYFTWNNKNKCK